MLFLPFFTLAISPILHTREAMIYALEAMVYKRRAVERYLPHPATREVMLECLPTLYRPTFHYAANGKLDVLTVDGLFLPINSERKLDIAYRRLHAHRRELLELSDQIRSRLHENRLHRYKLLADEDIRYLPFLTQKDFLIARMYEYDLRRRGVYLALLSIREVWMT